MRQEFVNPFLSAAQHVFEVELEHEFKFAVAQVTEDTITSENITASIGVSGRLEGNVFLRIQTSGRTRNPHDNAWKAVDRNGPDGPLGAW